jgi:hypothetical protein
LKVHSQTSWSAYPIFNKKLSLHRTPCLDLKQTSNFVLFNKVNLGT